MGTSTKRQRPSGPLWATAERIYQERQRDKSPSDETARQVAAALLRALTTETRRNPDAFGLRPAMRTGGAGLIDALDSLTCDGMDTRAVAAADPEGRRLAFTAAFAERVAGHGGTVADVAVRHAAVQAAEQLIGDAAVLQAIETSSAGRLPIPRSLFCAVYQMFFAHIVEQFLTSVIAEGTDAFLTAHFPVLPAVDPGGKIADWITQNIVVMLPTPCKDPTATGPSLTDLAKSLLTETVHRALGLPADGGLS